MSEIDDKTEVLKESYRGLTGFQLKAKYHEIKNNHTKENMIDDLTKMAAVMAVMEEKGIEIPKSTTRTTGDNYIPAGHEEESGINFVKVILGLVICFIGIFLTMSVEGSIFYGAILVGGGMVIAGLMGA